MRTGQKGERHMNPILRRDLVTDALEMAWFRRSPDRHAGLIFHSDRGSQYRGPQRQVFVAGVECASEDFNKMLK
jgi:transposase InsO family protein